MIMSRSPLINRMLESQQGKDLRHKRRSGVIGKVLNKNVSEDVKTCFRDILKEKIDNGK